MKVNIEFSSIESAMAVLELLKGFEVVRKEVETPDENFQVVPVQPEAPQYQPQPMQQEAAPQYQPQQVMQAAPQYQDPNMYQQVQAPHSVPNPVPQSPIPSAPVYTPPVQQQYQQEAPQMQQQPAAVPTTAQTYTMEQLAVAATQIADSGRRNDLIGLLGSFGVQALTQLPKEHYGAFATQLRAMGAKL